MYTDMEEWTEIRLRVLNDKASKREILREKGMHWKTWEKIFSYSELPGYRMESERPKPKIGPFLERISEILESDKEVPKKQRHTAKRIYEGIKEEGYQGKYTQVKEAVSELKSKAREVFVPLTHGPGEAQVHFGEAAVKVSGDLRKVHFLVMALPYSDVFFVIAFERECTETWWEGHVRAFEFFEGVPRRISYDNTKVFVSQILHRRLKREAESEGEGTRQFMRALRLIEVHGLSKLAEAVTKGLRRVGAHTRDTVAQFLIPQPPWKPSTFRLDGWEHLQLVTVAGPDISSYQDLLSRGGTP